MAVRACAAPAVRSRKVSPVLGQSAAGAACGTADGASRPAALDFNTRGATSRASRLRSGSAMTTAKIPTMPTRPAPEKVSDQIERWLASDGDKALGGLID